MSGFMPHSPGLCAGRGEKVWRGCATLLGMDITCDELWKDLDASAEIMKRKGFFMRGLQLLRSVYSLSDVAIRYASQIERMTATVPLDTYVDPDGQYLTDLEEAQDRIRDLQHEARRTLQWGLLVPLHRAAFAILRARYAILAHDTDEPIPAPVAKRANVGDVIAALAGGPWAALSLLRK